MLRSAISQGTELGRQAKTFMDQGALVPDSVVIGLIQERVKLDDCKNGFILDGFPRTVPQADALTGLLSVMGRKIDLVVQFDIEDGVLVRRLSGRRIAPKSGAVYHIETAKPKVEGICDISGETLIQRDDDHADVIEKRLKAYHAQTAPLIEYYSARKMLKHINADQDPAKVQSELARAFSGH